MCNAKLWTRLVAFFDESYELIHVAIPLKDSFDEMADALAKELPDEKINLLGFSMGGYLASMFAIKYPFRVARLFLAASSPRAYPEEERRIRENGLNYILNNGFRELSHDKIRTLLDKTSYHDVEIFSLLQEMYRELGVHALTKQIDANVKRENLLMEIASLEIPITCCYSREDGLIKRSWLNILARQKKDARFIEYEGTSHMLPLEKPQELSDEIIRWIHS